MPKIIQHNATDIRRELEWLKLILRTRSALNAGQETEFDDVLEVQPPGLDGSLSAYAAFVREHELDFVERFLLVLAAAPYIKPELLDVFIQKNQTTQQIYTEFGGRVGEGHAGFLPTGETVMFILAGNDLARRFELLRYFEGGHFFAEKDVLRLGEVDKEAPPLNGLLSISREVLDLFTTGRVRKPTFSAEFPARALATEMEWEGLVLPTDTMEHLEEMETWLKHKQALLHEWQLSKVLRPGYKALFYGPPGTGKSLTAALLGKKAGLDVYRIDLSQMVSKYIGETEKNLSRVFDKAERKDWILFFDEGDALFGKRTGTRDAHDRYANQQVSYLLQRIEAFDGLVVLATNMKNNIDEAFLRRFDAIIHFPMPQPAERLRLWQNGFSPACTLEPGLDLPAIARQYELSGGHIVNVIQFSSLMALKRGEKIIRQEDVVKGVRREFRKAGRTV